MNALLRNTLALAVAAIATQAVAQVSFYEREGFGGESFTTQKRIANFSQYGFNERAASAVVLGERREVCEGIKFSGRCMVLRQSRYESLNAMGLRNRISSVRTISDNAHVNDSRYAPLAVSDNRYRRRNNERLYEADVTSVRAVVGPPEQRCWIEREQVPQEQAKANLPGAIAGALIGGILGHQVGGGSGKDIATVGGAVAGGVVGSRVGRDGGQAATTRDVQHCDEVPSKAKPEFWDVTYNFRGQQHAVQMTSPPGSTVTVNEAGEPRH